MFVLPRCKRGAVRRDTSVFRVLCALFFSVLCYAISACAPATSSTHSVRKAGIEVKSTTQVVPCNQLWDSFRSDTCWVQPSLGPPILDRTLPEDVKKQTPTRLLEDQGKSNILIARGQTLAFFAQQLVIAWEPLVSLQAFVGTEQGLAKRREDLPIMQPAGVGYEEFAETWLALQAETSGKTVLSSATSQIAKRPIRRHFITQVPCLLRPSGTATAIERSLLLPWSWSADNESDFSEPKAKAARLARTLCTLVQDSPWGDVELQQSEALVQKGCSESAANNDTSFVYHHTYESKFAWEKDATAMLVQPREVLDPFPELNNQSPGADKEREVDYAYEKVLRVQRNLYDRGRSYSSTDRVGHRFEFLRERTDYLIKWLAALDFTEDSQPGGSTSAVNEETRIVGHLTDLYYRMYHFPRLEPVDERNSEQLQLSEDLAFALGPLAKVNWSYVMFDYLGWACGRWYR